MGFERSQSRGVDALRPVRITRGYTRHAEGSVLVECLPPLRRVAVVTDDAADGANEDVTLLWRLVEH